MLVKLTNDTAVRFVRGTILEVSDNEASRLFSLNNAVEVKEKTDAKPAKRKAKK